MTLYVSSVGREDCRDLILNVHYAKRYPSISYAFGLFEIIGNGQQLIGCCTFGTPSSAPLRSGIAGKAFEKHVLELNRLVLAYNRKNEASFLVGKCLKNLGNRVIVSFADTEQGHLGVVYQACNFVYTGLSAKRTDWRVKGMEHLHGQTVADEFRGLPNRAKLMREKYGDDFYLEPRSRKHRYIYVCGTKHFKNMVLPEIRYKKLPYPKKGINQGRIV